MVYFAPPSIIVKTAANASRRVIKSFIEILSFRKKYPIPTVTIGARFDVIATVVKEKCFKEAKLTSKVKAFYKTRTINVGTSLL